MEKSIFLVLALLALPTLALADEGRHGRDHDAAREAVRRGEIVPLSTVLEALRRETDAEVVHTELERSHGRLVYEIKVLTRDGRRQKFIYDATDGTRLMKRERP